MMKIQVLSDLHIEFAPFSVPHTDADLIVLAGDIGVGLDGIKFAKTLPLPVIYVTGNHELYNQRFPAHIDAMRDEAKESNVHFLENDSVVINDVKFLGCTLWTDFKVFGRDRFHDSLNTVGRGLMDYQAIKKDDGAAISPYDTLSAHEKSRMWLMNQLGQKTHDKVVVVTHHTPTLQSCPDRYKGELLTAGFASDLEDLMGKCNLWIHGHTHYCVDFNINGTRIVSNQRGYPREDGMETFKPDFVVEV